MKAKPFSYASTLFAVVTLAGLAGCVHEDVVATHENRGVDLAEKGKFDEAINEFTEALRLDPKDALAYYNRGAAFLWKGKPGKAVSDFDEAIRLNPKDPEVYEYRGIAHGQSKQFKEAISDFKQAAELNPKLASAYSSLAALRATCYVDEFRNAAEAVQAASKACELTGWKVSLHIDRLAAAYAETGDWEKAIAYQKKAMDVGATSQEEHNRMTLRLVLYEHHHPFRDPTIFE